MGHLCGYVRVPRGHALHGKRYSMRRVERGTSVHGGLTFSGCHKDRSMKRGHWFGFDCAHGFDLVPRMVDVYEALGLDALLGQGVYRTVAYVRAECAALAGQLARKAGR